MKDPNRERKNEIKYGVTLNEEQKQAKSLIVDNQIVVITGRAGSGKSLVTAQASLDFLNKKMVSEIWVTRAMQEVGDSMGYLPGDKKEKFNPYLEAFIENCEACMDKVKIKAFLDSEKIKATPVQFIRGKTNNNVLVIEEAQNLNKHQMLALLTRLGKTGKIIINGDTDQTDVRHDASGPNSNGLKYVIELSKKIQKIKWIKLKENHRSDLVGEILDYEYAQAKKNDEI